METLRYLYNLPHTFNANDSRNFLDAYPDYPLYAAVLYLTAVFYLPDFLKKRNRKLQLKYPVALWNFTLSLISFIGAFYADRLVYDLVVHDRGFHNVCCEVLQFPDGSQFGVNLKEFAGKHRTATPPSHAQAQQPSSSSSTSVVEAAAISKSLYGAPAFFIAVFMYLKTPELLDTVFLILQGKPVSFLHWFHHIATAIFCWHASYALTPSGLFFAAMNYSVHAIMYFYFGLVTLGLRKTIRPFAPVITLLQCTQMFLGVGITGYTYLQYWLSPEHTGGWFYALCSVLLSTIHVARQQVMHVVTNGSLLSSVELVPYKMEEHFIGCDTDTTNLRMGVMMYGSYCVLFGVLFKELYLDKRVNQTSLVLKRTNGEEARESKEKDGKPSPDVEGIAPYNRMDVEGSSSAAVGRAQTRKG